MQKYFLFLFLSMVTLNANIVIEKVENIVGSREYQKHQSLINLLFKQKDIYTTANESIKYFNMFTTLQKNGLLNLDFEKPTDVEIVFKIIGDNKKGYKILNDLLHTLGYRYFFTKSLENNSIDLLWNISFKVEYMLDPVMFLKELKYSGARVNNISRMNKFKWIYEIDFNDARLLQAQKIERDEKVKFQKPLEPLFLDIEGASGLSIMSRSLNRWFPDIVFFDKNLNLINEIKIDKVYKGIKTEVPEGTKYVKITDKYNLINIKRGLTLIVR